MTTDRRHAGMTAAIALCRLVCVIFSSNFSS
jgi:hypothetical protein